VVADVLSSQVLFDAITDAGGKPVMAASGHSLVKEKMAETGALLGGEMSGHIFLAEDYFGFDDPFLAAGRLHAHRRVWDTPFIAEMREWRPGRGERDDGLDAVSGCLLSEPVRLPRHPPPSTGEVKARTNWRPGQGGFTADTHFKV